MLQALAPKTALAEAEAAQRAGQEMILDLEAQAIVLQEQLDAMPGQIRQAERAAQQRCAADYQRHYHEGLQQLLSGIAAVIEASTALDQLYHRARQAFPPDRQGYDPAITSAAGIEVVWDEAYVRRQGGTMTPLGPTGRWAPARPILDRLNQIRHRLGLAPDHGEVTEQVTQANAYARTTTAREQVRILQAQRDYAAQYRSSWDDDPQQRAAFQRLEQALAAAKAHATAR